MQRTVREVISWPPSLLDSGEISCPLDFFFVIHVISYRDYLHEDKIPDWLGGLAQIPIPEGGLVPKNFYMSSQVNAPAKVI